MREEEFRLLSELEGRFWWFRGMRALTAALLATERPRLSGACILDVGCGTGFSLEWLAEWTGAAGAVGIDIQESGLRFGRARRGLVLVRGSAAALPFADASFDLVTSFDVLDEFPDDRSAFDEIARVLRPGGIVFFRLPAFEVLRSRHDRAMDTARRTTVRELRAKLRARGLVVERATYANMLLLPPIAAIRLLRRFIPGDAKKGSDVHALPARLSWLDSILCGCLLLEARYLGRRRARLPCGVSALCCARKPLRGGDTGRKQPR